MEFEWDDARAEQNIVKHGVTFDYATRVFLDLDRIDVEDQRRDYGEDRRIVLGRIGERVFSVVYAPRQNIVRLIPRERPTRVNRGSIYDEAF